MSREKKKARTSFSAPEAPVTWPEWPVTQITGAAELHTVLIRVAFAKDAFEVLGIKRADLTRELVEQQFNVLHEVVNPTNVRKVSVGQAMIYSTVKKGMKHYDVMIPFAWQAYGRMHLAKTMLLRLLEDSMLARVNAVLAGTGVQYAFARD
jgi:hypothetical protein